MRLLCSCVLAVLCTAPLPAADPPQTKLPPDKELIQGAWTVKSFREGGNAIPKAQTTDMRVVVDAKTITFRKVNQDGLGVRYTLDPTQEPKALDTTHTLDPGKPIAQLGIYSLEGDTLTLWIAAAGQDRPKDFQTKAASVIVLTRKFGNSSSGEQDVETEDR